MWRSILIIALLLGIMACSDDEDEFAPGQAPSADFNIDQRSIEVGKTITFEDRSQNDPTEWTWHISDEDTMTYEAQNPEVTFEEEGVYDIQLKVSNREGSDEKIREDHILVSEDPPEEVKEENNSLINKYTATWCRPCGTWGWDFFEEVVMEDLDEKVLMTLYATRGEEHLYSEDAAELAGLFEAPSGTPTFMVNGEIEDTEGQNVSEVYSNLEANMKETINEQQGEEATVNSTSGHSVEDNILSVTVETRFFSDVENGYDLSVFLVEHDVQAFQEPRSEHGSEADHKYVARKALNEEGILTPLTEDGAEAGERIFHHFETDIPEEWNERNFKIVTMAFERGTFDVDLVNASW